MSEPSSSPSRRPRHRRTPRRRGALSLPAVVLLLALGGVGIIAFNPFDNASQPASQPAVSPSPTQAESAAAAPGPQQASEPAPTVSTTPVPPARELFMTSTSRAAVANGEIDDPKSLLAVINKQRPFGNKKYTPKLRPVLSSDHEMRPEAADALEEMLAAAGDDGVDLGVLSAYRSYSRQSESRDHAGQTHSGDDLDQISARPGFSEHQSGLAVDLGMLTGKCDLEACFAKTPGGEWLQKNSSTFGFIVRYPKDQQDTTGYVYEPWHMRFIGVEAAQDMRKSGAPTLEHFFGLRPAPDY